TIRWLGARPDQRLEDQVTGAVATAWREQTGDILAFLPGVAQIERTAALLAERLPTALVLPLHGQVDPAAQRTAIKRDFQGRRRIVLATSIAETSLTLDGVSVVVDAGLSRRAEFDKAAGVTRLITTRASQASASQRAGRAARQGPGVAYRLWEEAAHAGRPAFDPPEVTTSDLAPLALTRAQWGAGDPAAMAWRDAPPVPALNAAKAALQALGALDGEGRITPHGQAMSRLSMEPALAHMLLFSAERGQANEAARLALLLQERGLGGRGEDLGRRLDRWAGERGNRADASRKLAARWADTAGKVLRHTAPAAAGKPAVRTAILLAEAFPDRIARARSASGEEWQSTGGRGYRLDPASPLATAKWLVIGDAQGEAKGARITAAMALEEAEVLRHLSHRMDERHSLSWNATEGRVEARLERRLGSIVLARVPDPKPDPDAVVALLIAQVRDIGLSLLPLSDASKALIERAGYAGLEALSEAVLRDMAEAWLAPLLTGRRDFALSQGKLHEALLSRLDWNERKELERLAPAEYRSPAGTTHAIDYAHEGGPCVELRVQALFGIDRHPCVGQPPRPLLLSLTSPGGKPIQTTADLPGFWRGSWKDVCKDMKGRYPRHRWPDEPWSEDASLKTKNAFNRSR
ncbi:MAG: ATP-dependent helicase HrpB, partial [Novosphingobium sp.]|nr:ATP-dependent helicase HrpB [Novosphingobium sp.]